MTHTVDSAARGGTKASARFYPAAARVLLGLMFLILGLNGFLNFLPQPTSMPAAAGAFLGGLAAAGYMVPLLSGVQVVVAVLLLMNRFVPLALAVIAPVIVNIAAFHLFLFSTGAPLAAVAVLLDLYLVWVYRRVYRSMLAMRVDPFQSWNELQHHTKITINQKRRLTMRFMVLVKASKESEAGALPSQDELARMGAFNEELVKAGVMLAGEGLQASSKGARVRFANGKTTVIDGPFAETKELIAGFWIWQVKSKDEAIAWLRRAPFYDAELEIRQVFEAEDFGPEFTQDLREQEDQLRAQIARK